MTERRCDGCVFWLESAKHEACGLRVCAPCMHTSQMMPDGDAGIILADWMCENWWPKDIPLPEPWSDGEFRAKCELRALKGWLEGVAVSVEMELATFGTSTSNICAVEIWGAVENGVHMEKEVER